MRQWVVGRTEPRIPWRRVVALFVLVLAAAIGGVWIAIDRRSDPAPHEAVLDEFKIPPTWTLAHSDIHRSIILGSWVARYYVIDSHPEAVVGPTSAMLESAGFTIDVVRAPRDWCDNRPLAATPAIDCPIKVIPPCSPNGPGGPVTCSLSATRNQDAVRIVAWDRGERTSFGFYGEQQHVVGAPDRMVVRLSTNY